MSSPKDAAIATVAELTELAKQYGVYAVAEEAGYPDWVAEQRRQVLAVIANTRNELRRLESSLQRLELAANSIGRRGSAQTIEREYTPLEGWALTLVGNYAMLVAKLRKYERDTLNERLTMFTRGSILKAKGVAAPHSLGTTLDHLKDASLVHKL